MPKTILTILNRSLLILSLAGCTQKKEAAPLNNNRTNTNASPFVKASSCIDCHQAEHKDWLGSHHQLAMQVANNKTVLGDFNNRSFEHDGATYFFHKQAENFRVRISESDNSTNTYTVAHVIGVDPLQQYLIPFPNGSFQVLTVCWDTRPKEAGGQRWYHIYPDEHIPPGDELHWKEPNFNWNYMCADCHTTNYRKNFDLKSLSYTTQWSEFNVSCESCHGPGKEHVAWAKGKYSDSTDATKGWGNSPKLGSPHSWVRDEEGKPKRVPALKEPVQAEACARCHARRSPIQEAFHHGQRIEDTHRVSSLEPGLYFPDGQIQDEVYVYGSFRQSKMYHAGVQCSDCHNPHSLELKFPGDNLCLQCHGPEFAKKEHHNHPDHSEGARCVSCHMPHRNYMVVDPRRDHRFGIPRPDLTEKTGSPNACNQCHQDQSPAWAAKEIANWFGSLTKETHYSETFHAATEQGPQLVAPELQKILLDKKNPGIIRATAAYLLQPAGAVIEGLKDTDPMVRRESLSSLRSLAPHLRLEHAGPLLIDSVRSVRIEAARILAAAPPGQFPAQQRNQFMEAVEEFKQAQMAVADRAGSHMGLGLLYTDMKDQPKAIEAYRDALRVEPSHIPSRINLAELLYQDQQIDEAEKLLREAVALRANEGILHEALGRFLIRVKRYEEGVSSIKQAAKLLPENAQIHYFCGVGLNQINKYDEAIQYLIKAHELDKNNADYLLGIVTIARDNGDIDQAGKYIDLLIAAFPEQPAFKQLKDSLK